jgi:hypothetical protein
VRLRGIVIGAVMSWAKSVFNLHTWGIFLEAAEKPVLLASTRGKRWMVAGHSGEA